MNKTRVNFLFSFLAIAFSSPCICVHAQDSSFKVAIVSPTAASLGKYGDMPVGYHTGTPNVNIPLYTVKAGKLSLPISLSYHASGLKVQEEASWVGAGWALNAGGVITRTVVGEPDDMGYLNPHVTRGYYADSGFFNYWFTPGSGPGTLPNGMITDVNNFVSGLKDGEPDLYFFNFGGYTGKFYFNDDRTPIFVPEQDFKVQPDYVGGSTLGPGFNGFIITTPDGVQYYFGGTGNTSAVIPIDVSTPNTTTGGASYGTRAISAWYLNKIISADGMDSIKFSYSQENYSDYTLSMYPQLAAGYLTTNYLTASTPKGYNLVKNFIQGVRLSQITFPNGSLNFTPSASPRQDLGGAFSSNSGMYNAPNTYSTNNPYPSYSLGSIQIADNNGYCKKDSFYFGYFYDNTPLSSYVSILAPSANIVTDAYRLRLDSLQETSCSGTVKVPPYKFSYFPELVQRKLGMGIDHWGFSNGQTNNAALVPTFTLQTGVSVETGGKQETIYGGNRDAAWPNMRGGALQQITYPTGGYTQFAFQPHDVYVSSTTTSITGSLGGSGSTNFEGNPVGASDTFVVSNAISGNTLELQISCDGNSEDQTYAGGNATISDLAGNTVFSGAAEINGDTAYYLTLNAGTYKITFYGSYSGPLSCSGDATLYTLAPVTTSGNAIVGGLRIDTLTTSDGMSTANNTVTTYNYGGAHSNGYLYSSPVYVQSIRNNDYGLIFGPSLVNANGCPAGDGSGSVFFVSPGSILPMATTQGNHIGYNQVTVSQAGNGSSIYQYYGSNYWNNVPTDVCTRTINITNCDPSSPSFPYAPLPYDYMRGELEYEAHLNQAGRYLKDAWYFPQYAFDSLTTPGYIPSNSTYFSVFTIYQLQSAYKTKDSIVATDYDPITGNSLTTTTSTTYGSRFHHQPTHKVTTTSTGDSLVTKLNYAFDFRISTCDNLNDSLQYYLSTARTDSINFNTLIGGCTPQNDGYSSCRFLAYPNFCWQIAGARNAYVNRRLQYHTGPNSQFSINHAAAKSAAGTELKPILELQDEFYNPALEITNWKDANLQHANFTRFDYAANPSTKIYPQQTQLINLQAVSSSFTPAATNSTNNSIVKDSRYLGEATYGFNLGNPVQVIAHDGTPVSYVWDYLNTEPIAKVTAPIVDTIAYTSFEADGSGNWTIASPIRDNTMAITGNSSYNLTNGAVSKSGLVSGNTYILSYWTTNTAAFSITGTQTGYPIQGKTITINGASWTYFEHQLTGQTAVSISGTGHIDELRLYPAGAQMTSYTYQPLLGMTSTCDVDNRVTYYTYDALGRLRYIRDQDGNILKTIEYHYQGQ